MDCVLGGVAVALTRGRLAGDTLASASLRSASECFAAASFASLLAWSDKSAVAGETCSVHQCESVMRRTFSIERTVREWLSTTQKLGVHERTGVVLRMGEHVGLAGNALLPGSSTLMVVQVRRIA